MFTLTEVAALTDGKQQKKKLCINFILKWMPI